MRKKKLKVKFNRTQWMVMMTDMRFGRVSIMGIIALLWMIAITALWVRSFHKTDSWIWIRPMRGGVIATNEGYLNIARFQITDPNHAISYSGQGYNDAPGELPIDNGLPWNVFAAMGSEGDLSQFSTLIDSTYRCSLVWVPLWAFELIALPFALRWVWMVVCQRLRKKRGECIQCGYDLRGTPNRCPECGTETCGDQSQIVLIVVASHRPYSFSRPFVGRAGLRSALN